eukprot:scaffold275509_cov19-Tisochrysis_lutea.AAC.1
MSSCWYGGKGKGKGRGYAAVLACEASLAEAKSACDQTKPARERECSRNRGCAGRLYCCANVLEVNARELLQGVHQRSECQEPMQGSEN